MPWRKGVDERANQHTATNTIAGIYMCSFIEKKTKAKTQFGRTLFTVTAFRLESVDLRDCLVWTVCCRHGAPHPNQVNQERSQSSYPLPLLALPSIDDEVPGTLSGTIACRPASSHALGEWQWVTVDSGALWSSSIPLAGGCSNCLPHQPCWDPCARRTEKLGCCPACRKMAASPLELAAIPLLAVPDIRVRRHRRQWKVGSPEGKGGAAAGRGFHPFLWPRLRGGSIIGIIRGILRANSIADQRPTHCCEAMQPLGKINKFCRAHATVLVAIRHSNFISLCPEEPQVHAGC